MSRVTDGTRRSRRRKKILQQTKGFRGKSGKLLRQAKDALAKAGQNAYNDRKRKKRDFRSLWVARISAACRERGMRYSEFIYFLKKANIELNRKVLSNMALADPQAFDSLVQHIKR